MEPAEKMSISVTTDGPYVVKGSVPLAVQTIASDAEGNSIGWIRGEEIDSRTDYSLCRCGHSANKPFCDGSHVSVGFVGTETATGDTYVSQATEQVGPSLILTDAQALCAFARFCDVAGQIWNLVEQPGDDAAKQTVLEAGLCPAGRLVAWHPETGGAIEPTFEPSIGLVDDPHEGVAGPIWVRGGIPVRAADGTTYEIRNRVTLCRCGASQNKPFCDGSHATIGFSA